MFNPGETVVCQYIIPFSIDDIAKVIITFKRYDDVLLAKTITSGLEEDKDPDWVSGTKYNTGDKAFVTKDISGLTYDTNFTCIEENEDATFDSSKWNEAGQRTRIVLALSQEESLLFGDEESYRMQINVYTLDGTRAASREVKANLGVQHYREVIQDES